MVPMSGRGRVKVWEYTTHVIVMPLLINLSNWLYFCSSFFQFHVFSVLHKAKDAVFHLSVSVKWLFYVKGWWDAQTKTLSYISFLHEQMCRSTIYAWTSVYTLTCRTLELCDVLVADTSHIQCRHVLPHRGSVAVFNPYKLCFMLTKLIWK